MTRTPPIDPVVASKFKRLPEHLQELWLERAAIRQYDGGQSRDLADTPWPCLMLSAFTPRKP